MEIRGICPEDHLEFPTSVARVFHGPQGMENIVSAEVLVEYGPLQTHVPWQPDEIDLAKLAHGGTIWLTVMGGLPPHYLEVRGRTDA